MATMELPPRRSKPFLEATIQRNRTSLEILLQMGFSLSRAEKALAATGDKGVQMASDWLLAHVNDPALEKVVERDYILYLCPVGQLQTELVEFWQKSFSQCGWNHAHNFFPHITMCSFFKADDSHATALAHILKNVGEKLKENPATLPLDYFSSANYLGLFVNESTAQVIKQVTADFAEEAKKLGVTVEPHKKHLHVSLAYRFPPDNHETLETLAKSINIEAPVRWDVRLYSRDQRVANNRTHKVIYPHTPQMSDELELIDGDFIYFPDTEIESSLDGWYKGTSSLTGVSGMFPGSYSERTAETETWTMHRSIPIIGTESALAHAESSGPFVAENALYSQIDVVQRLQRATIANDNTGTLSHSSSRTIGHHSATIGYHSLNKSTPPGAEQEHIYNRPVPQTVLTAPQQRGVTTITQNGRSAGGPRQLYVIRHGERIDFTFGKDWIQMSFDQNGRYIRHDLNMPNWLPKRKNGPQEFSKDSPLTVQGHFQAKTIGDALKDRDVPIDHVYASPSLRCVETATSILQGLGVENPINIEPGLFEWLGWYQQSGLPKFMSIAELRENGFNVANTHTPICSVADYNIHETIEQHYERCYKVTQAILERHQHQAGNVLLVAHAGSLDVCTRQIVDQRPRNTVAFHEILHKVPYLSVGVCQEDCIVKNKWRLIEPPILGFAHTNNPKYNWSVLYSQSHSNNMSNS